MPFESIFYACNYGVIAPWCLLIVAPRWPWTQRIAASATVPLVFGVAYAVLLLTDTEGSPDASFFTLEGVVAIFDSPQTVAAAWIHYLIIDLFVGAWIARDAHRLAIPHYPLVAPLLVLTLMFGPIGLMTYLGLRAFMRRRWLFDTAVETSNEPAG